MKHSLLVTFVLVVIVGSLVGIVSPAAAQSPEATVNSDPLNVRLQPTKNAEVITSLKFNSKYPVLSQTVSGYWLKVDIGGTQGWVCSEFVKLNVSKASLSVDDKVVNEDCNGKSKTAKSLAVTATPKATAQRSLKNKYDKIRVGKYPDVHYQIIDLETKTVLFQTSSPGSPNDVKSGGFCADYDKFVAIYHFSIFTWAGVWEVPSGKFLYFVIRPNVYLYSYVWACNPD